MYIIALKFNLIYGTQRWTFSDRRRSRFVWLFYSRKLFDPYADYAIAKAYFFCRYTFTFWYFKQVEKRTWPSNKILSLSRTHGIGRLNSSVISPFTIFSLSTNQKLPSLLNFVIFFPVIRHFISTLHCLLSIRLLFIRSVHASAAVID